MKTLNLKELVEYTNSLGYCINEEDAKYVLNGFLTEDSLKEGYEVIVMSKGLTEHRYTEKCRDIFVKLLEECWYIYE